MGTPCNMSNRKFERPRHGHLGFAPRKRCSRAKAKIQSFPKDDSTQKPHFTAFPGYKAGMTHVLREVKRAGSRLDKKETVDACTIIETPPVIVVGLTGYEQTIAGLKTVTTVFADHLSEGVQRRFRKTYRAGADIPEFKSKVDKDAAVKAIKEKCIVVRAIVHTQPDLIPQLNQKKAHVMEIQINGGSVAEKVDFIVSQFEQAIHVSSVFEESESTDLCSISKGKGNTGVITRWGVNRLPRKTHRGLRKVACIGSWHPARCAWTVPRVGQLGYHQRTEINKRIYRIGAKDDPRSGSTGNDITEKTINPLGGFPNYGNIKNDFCMVKGCIVGVKKRFVAMRKPILPPVSRTALEPINIKFIDTSSKMGTGKFQTIEEKKAFYGPMKKELKLMAAANIEA